MTKNSKTIVSKLDTKKQEPQSFKLLDPDPELTIDCSICSRPIKPERGRKVVWYEGNNAEPVKNGRCCDWCNNTEVMPSRLWGANWKGKSSPGVTDMWYRYHHQEQDYKEARNNASEMASEFEIPDHKIWDFQDWWIKNHAPPKSGADYHAHKLIGNQYETTMKKRNEKK